MDGVQKGRSTIDTSKHRMVFDPTPFNHEPYELLVIGCGAVGSMVAMHLAKLGLQHLTLLDPDVVEHHNLANQLFYGPEDVGVPKVHALTRRINQLVGFNPYLNGWQTKVTSEPMFRRLRYDYVFCCVDNMAARDIIFNQQVFMNGHTKYFADGRMSARSWRTYGFNPNDLRHVNKYRQELYPDQEVSNEHTAACQITPSIAATAGTVANAMIWQFIHHSKRSDEAPQHELCGTTQPWRLVAEQNFNID